MFEFPVVVPMINAVNIFQSAGRQEFDIAKRVENLKPDNSNN